MWYSRSQERAISDAAEICIDDVSTKYRWCIDDVLTTYRQCIVVEYKNKTNSTRIKRTIRSLWSHPGGQFSRDWLDMVLQAEMKTYSFWFWYGLWCPDIIYSVSVTLNKICWEKQTWWFFCEMCFCWLLVLDIFSFGNIRFLSLKRFFNLQEFQITNLQPSAIISLILNQVPFD